MNTSFLPTLFLLVKTLLIIPKKSGEKKSWQSM